jgi:hypothetical protein
LGICFANVVEGAQIAWVSQNADSAGLDQGFVAMLEGAGHTVTRHVVNGTANPPTAIVGAMNAADLTIVGRAVASGDFDGTTHPVTWNTGVTKPVMFMSAYVVRRNRLGLSTGDGVPDIQNTPLQAVNPSHPVFQGVALGANDVTTADYNEFNSAISRGTTMMGNLPRGGTVIARHPTLVDTVAIAEWARGTTVQDEANVNYILTGPRFFFAGGTRELDGGSIPSAGVDDLAPLGETLFLNTVNYAVASGVPEPSTFAVLGLGLSTLMIRRRR